MKQVLEYIMQNYTLFLGGIVLILLAIIGYYADKTNFGQGKSLEKKDSKEPEKKDPDQEETKKPNDSKERTLIIIRQRYSCVGIEITIDQANEKEILSDNEMSAHTTTEEIAGVSGSNYFNIVDIDKTNLEDTINAGPLSEEESKQIIDIPNEGDNKQNGVSDYDVNLIDSNSNFVVEKKDASLLNDEEFNRFNEEFNSILPKKELINTDLLSDIDDLELGRTQKIDLSDIPDLDDIELPKIKQLSSEEQDIWKF